MAYEAKIIADSESKFGRLTTMQVTYPRYIHSELMTHRDFSRNAASSRAIPIEKMIERIRTDPVIPMFTGAQKGMQGVDIDVETRARAEHDWLWAAAEAVASAGRLSDLGIHKQNANRLLEPFSWMTVIITSSRWENFFEQRCHPDAQPELQHIARMMRYARNSSMPEELTVGQWHLPYISEEEKRSLERPAQIQVSVARCARVSYLTQEGKRDIKADLTLYDRLIEGMHWSPFEHVAKVGGYHDVGMHGNFDLGWVQFRKMQLGEYRP